MNLNTRSLLLYVALCLVVPAHGQVASHKIIHGLNLPYVIAPASEGEGLLVGGGRVVSRLDADSQVDWCVQYDAPNFPSLLGLADAIDGPMALFFYSPSGHGMTLAKFDTSGGLLWDKEVGKGVTPGGVASNIVSLPDGACLACGTWIDQNGGPQGGAYCVKVSAQGDVIWAKIYNAGLSSLSNMALMPSGGLLLSINLDSSSVLVTLREDGELLDAREFRGLSRPSVDVFPSGDILLSGILPNGKQGLARLSSAWDTQWAMAFGGEGGGYSKVAVTTSGNVLYRPSGFGSSLLKISGGGQFQWGRSYGVTLLSDGYTAISDDGFAALGGTQENNVDLRVVLRADSLGIAGACTPNSTCLVPQAFELPVPTAITLTVTDTLMDFAWDGTVALMEAYAEDYCQPASLPSAAFEVADTLCLGSCIEISGLAQQAADTWAWRLEGFSPASSDSQDPGVICATSAGTTRITQVVGYAGCLDSFSRIVTVLPALEPMDIGPDTLVCEGIAYALDATVPGASSYDWEDGVTGAVRTLNSDGIYVVTASSKYCARSDTVVVRFFERAYPEGTLGLRPDTTICDGVVLSIGTDLAGFDAYLWDDGVSGSQRTVSDSGTYGLAVSLEGCRLYGDVKIEVERCNGDLYLPDAFSPNGDGVNDTFGPLGPHLRILSLKIFDRWGGLLWEGPSAWNGNSENRPAPAGSYVYVVECQDTRTGVQNTLSGGVLLVR